MNLAGPTFRDRYPQMFQDKGNTFGVQTPNLVALPTSTTPAVRAPDPYRAAARTAPGFEGGDLTTPSVVKEYQAGNIEIPKTPVQKPNAIGEIASTAGDYASSLVGSAAEAKRQTSALDYAQKMAEYKDQGKYWFDPNATLEPDLDKYLSEMPSAVDALAKTTITGEMLGEGTSASNAALGIMSLGISGAFDDKQEAAHILSKSGERALEGLAVGGWVGAIVGGVAGIVEGVFGWKDAEQQDKENKKRALSEYEKKLKEWQALRAKRIADYNSQLAAQQFQNRMAASEKRKLEEKEEKTDAAQRRKQMAAAIMNAGSASAASRASRVSRWR